MRERGGRNVRHHLRERGAGSRQAVAFSTPHDGKQVHVCLCVCMIAVRAC